jgi:type IV pilus assembly protein PilM
MDVAARTAIGLDIGTSGVRAAELSFGRGGVTLEKFGQLAVPEGSVRDGEVVDTAAVADIIKQLWAHTKFGSKKVVLGVANQKVIVRQVDLPWMPPAELKKSLAFQVADFIPMPVEAAVLDFHPLEERVAETGGARLVRGLLVAASREMVMANLEAVQRAGLSPVMVDLTSFAVIRALSSPDHLGMGTEVEALVDVGARVTNIVVHEGGVPRFVRILLMGGQDVTDAVAERMGVPQDDAEAIKQRIGNGEAGDGMDAQAAVRVVEAVGAAFVDEVRGSLDYYLASSGSSPITRLVLTGGGSRLGGLVRRLEVATRVPVQVGTPLQNLVVGRTGLSPEQIAFVEPLAAVPVGLALGVAS